MWPKMFKSDVKPKQTNKQTIKLLVLQMWQDIDRRVLHMQFFYLILN